MCISDKPTTLPSNIFKLLFIIFYSIFFGLNRLCYLKKIQNTVQNNSKPHTHSITIQNKSKVRYVDTCCANCID